MVRATEGRPISELSEEAAAQRQELRNLLVAERDQALRQDNPHAAVVFQQRLDKMDAEQNPTTGHEGDTGDEHPDWGGGVRRPITPPPDMNTLFRQMRDAAKGAAA